MTMQYLGAYRIRLRSGKLLCWSSSTDSLNGGTQINDTDNGDIDAEYEALCASYEGALV